MIPVFFLIIFAPLISYLQEIHSRLGTELDLFTFWKDKWVWICTLLALPYLKRIPWPVTAFLAFLLYATITSIDPIQSLWGMPNYGEGSITILCYALLFCLGMEFSEFFFLCASSLAVLGLVALMILQIIYGNYLEFPPIAWASGLSGMTTHSYGRFPLYMSLMNPNHLGLFCALLTPVFLRVPNYWLSGILTVMAVGSGSRAALLAICLTLPWKKLWKYALCGVMGAAFLNLILHHRLFIFSSSGRLFMWKNTLPLIRFLGNGPATFIYRFPQTLVNAVHIWPIGTVVDRPHNMYLQIAYSTGFLSLISLVYIAVMATRKDTIMRYGIWSFLICAFFTDSFVGVTPIFCVMAGMGYNRQMKGKHV